MKQSFNKFDIDTRLNIKKHHLEYLLILNKFLLYMYMYFRNTQQPQLSQPYKEIKWQTLRAVISMQIFF